MAFVSAVLHTNLIMGSKKVAIGTYTNGGGDSGGNIDTGIARVEFMVLQPTGSAVIASSPTINEDFSSGSIDGTAVTIVNTANEDGIWIAWGK